MTRTKEARCYGGFAFARFPEKNKGGTTAEVERVAPCFSARPIGGRSVMLRSDHGPYATDKCRPRANTLIGNLRESTTFHANRALRKNYLNNYKPMRRR